MSKQIELLYKDPDGGPDYVNKHTSVQKLIEDVGFCYHNDISYTRARRTGQLTLRVAESNKIGWCVPLGDKASSVSYSHEFGVTELHQTMSTAALEVAADIYA